MVATPKLAVTRVTRGSPSAPTWPGSLIRSAAMTERTRSAAMRALLRLVGGGLAVLARERVVLIEVRYGDRQGLAVAARPLDLLPEPQLEVAAVVHAGERVADGHALDLGGELGDARRLRR